MATKIQLRRGTASQWTSTNPTLSIGEIGVESDTNKFKLGDGSTPWTSLDYFANVSDIDALPSQSGNSGKYLTTSGSAAYWAELVIPTVDLHPMFILGGS
jgi:hypothetical protein